MEWKRKHIKLPNKTISGQWFAWKHVWCRPINDISKKLEYAFNPDGLETEFARITWTQWFRDNGWVDELDDAIPKIVDAVKPKKPTSFNEALRLSLNSTTTHVKTIHRKPKPTAPPPSPSPKLTAPKIGAVAYDKKSDVMAWFNGVEWVRMTQHEVRLELYKTKLDIIHRHQMEQ